MWVEKLEGHRLLERKSPTRVCLCVCGPVCVCVCVCEPVCLCDVTGAAKVYMVVCLSFFCFGGASSLLERLHAVIRASALVFYLDLLGVICLRSK